jgi:lipopolysaccharide transport system ATP-binding protein
MLVDEILAVGDMGFQSKSIAKMGEVISGGRTILFVSHNMAAVRSLCQKAVYLENGRVMYHGSVDDAIGHYLRSGRDQKSTQFHASPEATMPLQFLDAYLTDEDGNVTSRLPHDQPFLIHLRVAVRAPQFKVRPSLKILDGQLDTVLSSYDFEPKHQSAHRLGPGIYAYTVRVPVPLLVPGQYRLSLSFIRTFARSSKAFARVENICPFEIYDNGSELAKAFIRWHGKVAPALQWARSDAAASEKVP